MPQKVGLPLNNEVSLKVDWATLGEKLFKTVTGGFKAYNGDFKGGADAFFALLGAAKAVKQDVPLGARALELILLCFAWSFDSLRAGGHLDDEKIKEAAKKAIASLKKQVEGAKISIPYDFFEQPSSAEPYLLLRDQFVLHRSAFRASTSEKEELVRVRFDSAFRSAVWAIWADRSATFEELARVLESPAAKTADFERQWQAYRESLIGQFHITPVFGQEETKVSLGQLYTPLRCFWREIESIDDDESRYADVEIPQKQTCHVRNLQDELDSWLDSDDEHDWLRLIGGGPGSGKSTSAKAFAARLAERDDVRPLFISLQHLRPNERLREAINRYYADRTGSPFQVGPLERKYVEGGVRLVLIFDGLDEIARPGESADNIAKEMIEWIRDLRSDLTGDLRVGHKVLVTGRMPSFQAARRRFNSKGKEALEVLDLLNQQKGSMRSKTLYHGGETSIEGDESLIQDDHRHLWWKNYSVALGRPEVAPRGLTDERLESLTAEPLLCYLLALSGYLESDSDKAANNRNYIFQRLLSDVWKRGWGDGRAGTGKDLREDDFNRLFETMALAAWHGGDERVATYDRFLNALRITQTEHIFENFKSQEGGDVSNLAVNFYMKRPDENEKGFEFTHKSFGEYLTARALVRKAIDIGELSERRFDTAVSEWIEVAGEGNFTTDLYEFLIDEGKFLPSRNAILTKRRLEKILAVAIDRGLPINYQRCESCEDASMRQRRAVTSIIGVIQSMSERISKNNKEHFIGFGKEKMLNLNKILAKLNFEFGSMPGSLLKNVYAPDTILNFSSLFCINFGGGWLERAHFQFSSLHHLDFSGANLKSSFFDISTISYCLFNSVDLRKTSFTQTCFINSSLNEAKLQNAKFMGAKFIGVSFRKAKLSKANFEKSIFVNSDTNVRIRVGKPEKSDASTKEIDFREANLEQAIFEEAILEGACFDGSNLKGAVFKNARLKGADFSNAILENTVFENADLEGAVFKGVDLEHGAILKGANVEGIILGEDESDAEIENPTRTDREVEPV